MPSHVCVGSLEHLNCAFDLEVFMLAFLHVFMLAFLQIVYVNFVTCSGLHLSRLSESFQHSGARDL